MKGDITSQILLLIAGAIAGIFSGAIGAYYKASLDRKAELQKTEASVRLKYLYPLLVAAIDLRHKLIHVYQVLQGEKDVSKPEPEMTDRYYLRHWFWECKEYVVDSGRSQQQRGRELAMHSGGVGYDAVSSLYITATYLWHATRIRYRIPSDLEGKGIRLLEGLNRVRESLGDLEFYDVTQDSTGASVTSETGDLMNYREFCEAMTSDGERAWFLTLCDFYFKLHLRDSIQVKLVEDRLADLILLIRELLALNKREPMRHKSLRADFDLM